MIPQQKDKKKKLIYIYILLLILITSINNKNIYNGKIFSNELIFKINGLSYTDNEKLISDLIDINNENIFKIDKKKILEKVTENNLVLNFFAKKEYPNKIEIIINKATYVGRIYKKDKLFLIGSNGKLIDHNANNIKDLPYFYGDFKREEFLKLLFVINKIQLDIKNISSFYFFPSGRWDIKFKDGLLLKLPIKDLRNTLSKVLLLKNNQNFRNSKIIDLRIKNRIISND
jgi:cell division septal protein FtsQ